MTLVVEGAEVENLGRETESVGLAPMLRIIPIDTFHLRQNCAIAIFQLCVLAATRPSHFGQALTKALRKR